MISPESGKDFASLQANNPYRNYKYTQSSFDKIGNWLNSRVFHDNFIKTREQSVADDMANKAAVYDAQIGEVQREEMYNSATEQAERMRAAGINPDLQSSGISGGEATPFDNQAVSGMPELEQESDLQRAGNFISSVLSIASGASSLVASGINTANAISQYKSSKLSLFSQTHDVAKSILDELITESEGLDFWNSLSEAEIIKRVVNDPRIKTAIPLYSMRKSMGHEIARQVHSLSNRGNAYDVVGKYKSQKYDPMNYDDSMIALNMQWTAVYNKCRMENLARFERRLSELGVSEDKAYLESLQAQNQQMEMEALQSYIEMLASLYKETNDQRYAYAYTMAQQLMSGQIDSATGFYFKSKLKEAFSNEQPSEGAGTDNDQNAVDSAIDDITTGISDTVTGITGRPANRRADTVIDTPSGTETIHDRTGILEQIFGGDKMDDAMKKVRWFIDDAAEGYHELWEAFKERFRSDFNIKPRKPRKPKNRKTGTR